MVWSLLSIWKNSEPFSLYLLLSLAAFSVHRWDSNGLYVDSWLSHKTLWHWVHASISSVCIFYHLFSSCFLFYIFIGVTSLHTTFHSEDNLRKNPLLGSFVKSCIRFFILSKEWHREREWQRETSSTCRFTLKMTKARSRTGWRRYLELNPDLLYVQPKAHELKAGSESGQPGLENYRTLVFKKHINVLYYEASPHSLNYWL